MIYIPQNRINTIVLAKFFRIAQTDQAALWHEAVVAFFSKKIGRQRINMALDVAINSGYLDSYTDDDGDRNYQITASGYAVIEEMYLKEDSQIREFINTDFKPFLEGEDSDQLISSAGDVPASDRLVLIGDNLPGYQEMLATIEGAAESIRASNSMVADEKSWIRHHLDLGLELLRKGGTALRSALRALIYEPLKAALKDANEENMKLAVRAALEALKTFLGIQ